MGIKAIISPKFLRKLNYFEKSPLYGKEVLFGLICCICFGYYLHELVLIKFQNKKNFQSII